MALLLQSGDKLLLQSGDELLLQQGAPEGLIAVEGPLQAPQVVTSTLFASVQLPGILGNEQVVASTLFATVQLPGILVSPFVLGNQLYGQAQLPSILAGPDILAYSDYSGGIPDDALIYYAMDLTTPGGLVRVPISSWQATLQVDRSNYVQCVIPACLAWLDDIAAATRFSIVRGTRISGEVIEQEMAFTEPNTKQYDQGPSRYTCTLSGYANGFAQNLDPDDLYDRTLTGVRSISSTGSGIRVRCAIDWLLLPGQRAILDDTTSFVVSYINYYSQARESYMDVGERG